MKYGLILAAGKQSRFDSDIPKPLMKINGSSVIEKNLKIMGYYCDRVYVAVSEDNKQYFIDAGIKNLIVIESGYGCGDGVLRALRKINLNSDDIILLSWGDAVQNDFNILKQTANIYNSSNYDIIIPCVYENKPYVLLNHDNDNNITNVLFSKYNEVSSPGYHDLSIFLFNGSKILELLEQIYDKLWVEGAKQYKTNHGNEFQFLDIFNYKTGDSLRGHIYPVKTKQLSFNTLEEFENIKEKI